MSDKIFSAMIDCSRNGVMKPRQIKKFIDYISAMGYNGLLLYTEDTYCIENEPLFGYLRGSYTSDEIKDIVDYGEEKGVEIIPCIQTLAHLNQMFKWWRTYEGVRDTDDILLIDEPRTYELIENMFKSIRKSYKTNKVHIGMDEAHNVGLGKFLEKHGYQNRFEILTRHLQRVVEIAKKYDFEPMMWSDMFFRLQSKGYYYNPDIIVDDKLKAGVPNEVSLVYWDYHTLTEEKYRAMIQAHEKFERSVWFAGGAWSWVGFTPGSTHNDVTLFRAMPVCREQGVENVIITLWGDDGKECSFFACLDTLLRAKMLYDGEDMSHFEAKFAEICGISHEDYRSLLLPNQIDGNYDTAWMPSKYALYNDPFVGYIDAELVEGAGREYAEFEKIIGEKGKGTFFEPIFKSQSALCGVLKNKYELGIHIRRAYQQGDREALANCVMTIDEILIDLEKFYNAFSALYMWENKPYGFEIQDIRLGGLSRRLKSCKKRLVDYLEGIINEIEELDERIIPVFDTDKGSQVKNVWCETWAKAVTVNILHH